MRFARATSASAGAKEAARATITTSTRMWSATRPPTTALVGCCRKPARSAGVWDMSCSTVAVARADDSEMRGIRTVAAVAACCIAAGALALPAQAIPVPGTTCDVFPSNNVWHLDVSRLPTHPKSDVWKKAMRARATFLHPDFGPPAYGIPFDVVDAAHADVARALHVRERKRQGPVPVRTRHRTSRAGPTGTRS